MSYFQFLVLIICGRGSPLFLLSCLLGSFIDFPNLLEELVFGFCFFVKFLYCSSTLYFIGFCLYFYKILLLLKENISKDKLLRNKVSHFCTLAYSPSLLLTFPTSITLLQTTLPLTCIASVVTCFYT